MEFKKIDDTKFQCLLYEEDLEDNNISIDDFFRNDTAKIHGLLDVVMEEAQKSIGVIMDGGVMSLQLAPQPNHSILLTISSGKDDFGDMLRQAGERASQAISALKPKKDGGSNVIKKDAADQADLAPDLVSAESDEEQPEEEETQSVENEVEKPLVPSELNLITADQVVFKFDSLKTLEEFCEQCNKTWGIHNSVYKVSGSKEVVLIMERGRCAEAKFQLFVNQLLEYGELITSKKLRITGIKEHCETMIPSNAINIIKKYCSR